METEKAFWTLDKHASEFNFPVLDNAYLQYGAARLSAFRGPKDWLIVFEVLSFSTREVDFVNDLYAYGSCLELGGLIGEESPFRPSPDSPIFDPETNECLADWKKWGIAIDNNVLNFSPSVDDYASAGISIKGDSGPGTLTEADLLRYAVFHVGERLFLKTEALLARFPECKGLSKFVQTTKWEHPDIAGGEKPSENIAIRSLIHALAAGNPSLFDPGEPNTNWKIWTEIKQ